MLLQLAVSNSIKTAWNSSLQAETLSRENLFYWNFCCFLIKSATVIPPISAEMGHYLVIRLKPFTNPDNQVIKDIKRVHGFTAVLRGDDDRARNSSFDIYLYFFFSQLLVRWARISFLTSRSDIPTCKPNPCAFYSLFCKGYWISFIFFKFGNPTYSPSYLNLYNKDVIKLLVICYQYSACQQLLVNIFT